MTARAALQSLIDADLEEGEALRLLGFTACEASNSLDTPEDYFFIVIRWGQDNPVAYQGKASNTVTIWFHSKGQDYGPIDKAMERVKAMLADVVHRVGDDGWTMTIAEWNGDSADLIDDGFGTITRNSAFTVVSRYNAT